MQERRALVIPGIVMFILLLVVWVVIIGLFGNSFEVGGDVTNPGYLAASIILMLLAFLAKLGFTIIQPNESRVITFLGRYLGTIRRNGWGWTWPLTNRKRVSLRIQNFDSQVLKVNDAGGSPVEVAAVIVWRVVETARASFEVEDYEDFVRIQTETAVRHMASLYPYDQHVEGEISLRSHADEVTNALNEELQAQLEQAGVEVIRTQLRRLAYAPEIAADMLRRQQADAVVAARFRIVEGAVSMVDDALSRLSSLGIVDLDEERKAQMVANLLVVLCSEHHAQPVVNTGTLY